MRAVGSGRFVPHHSLSAYALPPHTRLTQQRLLAIQRLPYRRISQPVKVAQNAHQLERLWGKPVNQLAGGLAKRADRFDAHRLPHHAIAQPATSYRDSAPAGWESRAGSDAVPRSGPNTRPRCWCVLARVPHRPGSPRHARCAPARPSRPRRAPSICTINHSARRAG